MLSVILIWIYLCITTFVIGYGVLRVLTRHLPYYTHNADAYLMCGLVCVTVYAQFFSLFAGVGLLANGILCLVCGVIVWHHRKGFWETVRRLALPAGKGVPGSFSVWRLSVILVLFLLFAYGTSRGMIHYDTGLYHAQSIRWIEEYGVVKGLGNLHCRLAYNSSSFALSALYSMAFLGGQSYHCAAGWLAFLLAVFCLLAGASLRAGRIRTSGFARVMCVYYLVNIFDEMVSPASDYFMVLAAFYIVIKWLDLLEREEREILPYGLLCVLGVFLMTVKLSAAFILLLTVYPACRLIREKRWGETGAYLGLGFVTALPFFIRNVVISGWLVYPFTQIDLFDAAWKIPNGVADYDAREIQVWGRGYTDVSQFDLPMREWLPGWFQKLAGSDKLLVLAAGTAAAALVFWAVSLLWRQCRQENAALPEADRAGVEDAAAQGGAVRAALLTVQGMTAASFLFWLCTSPLIRYGCVWVYLTPAVVFGGIWDTLLYDSTFPSGRQGGFLRRQAGRFRLAAGRVVSVLVLLLLVYKGAALTREIADSYVNDYWIFQKDYEAYETRSYEIEGVTFYCPLEGDQTGYESFPASPVEAEITFLGDGVEEGFRAAPNLL